MRILITSFGPFHDFSNNPSNIVMGRIESDFKLNLSPYHEIDYITLDVSYKKVDSFIRTMRKDYDLILHMGVAGNEKKMRFETIARNQANSPDIDGVNKKNAKIIVKQDNILTTNYPLFLIKQLKKKYFRYTKISKDAGTYLCNYIYFNSLSANNSRSDILFLHIADFQNNEVATSLEKQVEIIQETINIFIKNSLAGSARV